MFNAPPRALPVGERLLDLEEKVHELGRRIERIENYLMSREQEQQAEAEAPAPAPRDDHILDNEP